jgi:hypothetical protein
MSNIHPIPKTSGWLVCPSCGRKKPIDLSKYAFHRILVKCACGEHFRCQINANRITYERNPSPIKFRTETASSSKVLQFPIQNIHQSIVSCPNCGYKRNVTLPPRASSKTVFTIKCKCGQQFPCRFERPILHGDEKKRKSTVICDQLTTKNCEMKAFFVVNDGTATIVCSHCGFTRTLNSEEIQCLKKPFTLKCKCGAISQCRIDERKSYRKATHFNGQYLNRRTASKDLAVLENISMGGIGLTTSPNHDLKQGDFLDVSFKLDDAKGSHFNNTVLIRRINGKNIGCEFVYDQAYNKKLGFYLMT